MLGTWGRPKYTLLLTQHTVLFIDQSLRASNVSQVPESVLVSMLHPQYASLAANDKLREFADSAMSLFFRHIWTLLFSVSANNLLNVGTLDGLEKTFSKEAWQKSINDPFQVRIVAIYTNCFDKWRPLP